MCSLDITKFGSASAAQYAAKKGSYWFKPYMKTDPQSFAPAQINNLGISFQAGTKVVAMVVGVAMPYFSPKRSREVNRINDNYHVIDPLDSQVWSVQGLEVMNQTVYCNVASRAHFVTDTGLSQKRD